MLEILYGYTMCCETCPWSILVGVGRSHVHNELEVQYVCTIYWVSLSFVMWETCRR